MVKTPKTFLLPWVILGFLSVLLVWFYWPILTIQYGRLIGSEDYSYGLLLPLVSGYIIYLEWPRLKQQNWQPSWWGLVIMALGFLLYIFGELITDLYTSTLSFLLVVTGLVYLYGGWKLSRFLVFPLALLFLMIPWPDFVTRQLTLPLQLLSSRLATGILHTIGVAAVRQGNVIDLGVSQLQVVAACSGLRYILSLGALGIIFCYFYQRRLWKALVLLISLVPTAIVANALRVAAMGLYPVLQQEGFWHSFSGWLIFVFSFGLLALLNWLLNYLRPEAPGSFAESPSGETGTPGQISPGLPQSRTSHLLAALVLVLLAGPLAHKLAQAPPIPLLKSLADFPMQIGSWQGRHVPMDSEMVRATQCDAYLNADFQNPEHGNINLWIAYYESQKKAGGSVHSPLSCFRGGGWIVLDSQTVNLAPDYSVKYLLLDQGGTILVVYYWFIQGGRWVTNEYFNKLYTGFSSLVRRRPDGALVRLITPTAGDPQNVKLARERLNSFSELLIPVLPRFIKE